MKQNIFVVTCLLLTICIHLYIKYCDFSFQFSIVRTQRNELDPQCGCKVVKKIEETQIGNRSLCSQVATDRGSGQKIFAYSFFGSSSTLFYSRFYTGITKNLGQIRHFYPGYLMRLYVNWKNLTKEENSELCKVFCNETIFDICDVGDIAQYPALSLNHGRLWRFATMADPLCVEYHSRDLDSSITPREVAAVKDWNATGYSFHVMRDHKMQKAHILAGLHGMKIKSDKRERLRNLFDAILKFAGSNQWRPLDQHALSRFAWPIFKNDMVAHDSYLCEAFKSELNRPWPTRRISGPNFTDPHVVNYVGGRTGSVALKTNGPCPDKCRPREHRDWLLC